MATAERKDTQPAGFDFTLHMRHLCADMTQRVAELRYIDINRVAIGFCQTRKNVRRGMYATLTPMRFDGGRMHTIRRGRKWGVQRLYDSSGREMLYILSFYLPRFLRLGFREKLTTVIHELWHIGPEFDGDVRRYAGRCYAHSSSGQHDAIVERLTDDWLSLDPPDSVYRFLRYDFRELHRRHGTVYGRKIPAPKLLEVD